MLRPQTGLVAYSQTTPEALIEKCSEEGFVLLSTDEGSSIIESMGRYSSQSGADLSPYLKGFDGSRDNAARKGENSYGGIVRLCVDVSVQPSVLKTLMADDEMRSRGFINRFIMIVTPTTAGTLDYSKRPVKDDAIESSWAASINRINTMVSGLGEDCATLRLSTEADALHSAYGNEWQGKVGIDGSHEDMKDLFSRRHIAYALRISALYHLLMGGTLTECIGVSSMKYAIATCRMTASHYIAITRSAGTSENNLAERLLHKLVEKGFTRVSVRDIQRRKFCSLSKADKIRKILVSLSDMGYLIELGSGFIIPPNIKKIIRTHATSATSATNGGGGG